MRILLATIYDVTRSGGLSSHVEELAAGFASAGHGARILTPYVAWPAWRRRVVVDLPRLPLRILDRDAAYRYFLNMARRILSSAIERVLRTERVDVIHAHDPVALLSSRDALARLTPLPRTSAEGAVAFSSAAPVPCVLTVHGDIGNMAASDGAVGAQGSGRRMAEHLEALAYASADVVLTADDRLWRHCRALAPDCAPVAFPNFVNVERFRPASEEEQSEIARIRASIGVEKPGRLILVPRRLVKKTGVIFAVRAMAQDCLARSSCRDAVLVIAGDGPERAEVAREARSLGPGGTESRVRILGDVSRCRLADLYRAADAVVIPSIPHEGVVEATSISALEAMSSGAPVIASRIGGLAELIEDGRTGILVDHGDPRAIARAIVRVLEDRDSAHAIGLAARSYVERERSTASCVRGLVDLYERAGKRAS